MNIRSDGVRILEAKTTCYALFLFTDSEKHGTTVRVENGGLTVSQQRSLERIAADVNRLGEQMLSKPYTVTADYLAVALVQQNGHFAFRSDSDGVIIAVAFVYVGYTPFGAVATIESVVVDEKHRGKGLGREIVEECIDFARSHGVRCIELHTSREIAKKLYLSLGFKQYSGVSGSRGIRHQYRIDYS